MKTITVGKFKFVKTWVFPFDVSKFLIQMMTRFQKNTWSDEELRWIANKWIHVCCGDSKIGDIRIDIDPQKKPDIVGDAWNLAELLGKNSQQGIIIDPPWQINWRTRQLLAYQLRDTLKVGGILLCNSPWSPWSVGMDILAIWKVSPHFNNYRDLTDWWILRKVNDG